MRDARDRVFQRRILTHHFVERGAVEAEDFDWRIGRGARGGKTRAAAQQFDFAKVLAAAHRRDDLLRAVRLRHDNFDASVDDDVELLDGLALAQNDLTGRVLFRVHFVRQGDELGLGENRERLGKLLFDDLAVGDLHRARRALCQIVIMRHHQDRLAAFHQALEKFKDRVGGLGIEVAGRLIREQNRRIICQRARDRDALLLSAGNRGRQFVRVVRHLHLFEQVQRAFAAFARFVNVAEIHRQHDVFGERQRRQELKELKDDPKVAPAPLCHLSFVEFVHRGVADQHLACRRTVNACDHVDQRRLSAARFADDRDELAGIHAQVNAPERGEFASGGVERLDDLAQVNQFFVAVLVESIGFLSKFVFLLAIPEHRYLCVSPRQFQIVPI